MQRAWLLRLTLSAAALTACGSAPASEEATASSELFAAYTDAANSPIPDNLASGLTRVLTIDHGWDVVRQLRVTVRVTHPYRGDLRVVLVSAEGTELVLHNRTGGSADNLTIDRVVPNFDGQRVSGSWTLRVSDLAARDSGRLVSWALTIDHVAGPTPCDVARCAAGEHCELQPIVCIRAPCLPVAACVPDPTCTPDECVGPAPRAPTVECADGSWGGPACELGADGLCGWTIRSCPPTGPFCGSRGHEVYCAAGEYCHHEPAELCGRADAQGECRPIPQVCTANVLEVCGCDGATYGNECRAHAAGVSVDHAGPCQPAGAWDQKGADFGTTSPYRNRQTLEVTFYAPPDGSRLRLDFDRFDTERGYDFVTAYDASGNALARWSGRLGAMSPELDMPRGTNVRVVFTSDASIVRPGFHIASIAWWRSP